MEVRKDTRIARIHVIMVDRQGFARQLEFGDSAEE